MVWLPIERRVFRRGGDMTIRLHYLALNFGAVALAATPALAQTAACDSHTPAIIGGPVLPKDDSRMVLRWLANANYEISYGGQVFLFDTYFNRKARNRPIGFT